MMAALAVALAAGCTAQAVGAGSSATTPTPLPATSSSGPAASPTRTPSDDEPSPSSTPSQSAPSQSTKPQSKILMAEGNETEQVRELQARLRQLGHFQRSPTAFYGSITASAVRSFQSGQSGLNVTGSVNETTWQQLLAKTREPTTAELRPPTSNQLDIPDPRCMTGRVLCISKESRTLAWMIDGQVVSAMDVRFGSENTPTREGTFKVDFKSRDHVSTLYDTPMPYAMFFSRGQAVHYSSDFAARGYNGASHGCVNVRDQTKLAALFDQVQVGDKVVVHW
jgi:hypothetical protein